MRKREWEPSTGHALTLEKQAAMRFEFFLSLVVVVVCFLLDMMFCFPVEQVYLFAKRRTGA